MSDTDNNTPSPSSHVMGMTDEIVGLVIAAREAFDCAFLPEEESRALDKALEPFATKVRYANEPDEDEVDQYQVERETLGMSVDPTAYPDWSPEPAPADHVVGTALLDVAAERRRQIEAEGFAPDGDDQYANGELARAAASYAYEAGRTDQQRTIDHGIPPVMWPWGRNWWKSADRRRDLVKAAALIIAEIERLDRATATEGSGDA